MTETTHGLPGFLEQACWAHANWKKRLRRFAAGGDRIDPAAAGEDCFCDLGRWLHGEGKAYGNLPEYRLMRHEHAEFHRLAGELAAAIADGDQAHAENRLENEASDYNRASQRTIESILALRGAIA